MRCAPRSVVAGTAPCPGFTRSTWKMRTLCGRWSSGPGSTLAQVDDVIMGCAVSQIGPQTFDIARNAWPWQAWSKAMPGVTCRPAVGTSQQAVALRRRGQDIRHVAGPVVAAGRGERMRVVTMGSTVALPAEGGACLAPWGQGWREALRRAGDLPVPRRPARSCAEKWDLQAEPAGGAPRWRRSARGACHRRGPVRRPDRAAGPDPARTRSPRRHLAGEDGRPAPLREGTGRSTAGDRLADLRRRGRRRG